MRVVRPQTKGMCWMFLLRMRGDPREDEHSIVHRSSGFSQKACYTSSIRHTVRGSLGTLRLKIIPAVEQ